MAQYDVDLRDYWRILKKRRILVGLMVLLVGFFSYFFAKIREPMPVFQANAAVKIERRSSMADFFLGGFWAQSDSIATQAFIIRSYPVLAGAAQRLGWIPDHLELDHIREEAGLMQSVDRLRAMVSATPQSGTNILNIDAVSGEAELAAAAANAVAVSYREYNIREKNKETFETKAFIESQLESTEAQLRAAEVALREFKEKNDLVSMEAQSANTLSRMFASESELQGIREQQDVVASQLRSLKMGAGAGAGADSPESFGSPESFESLILPEFEGSPVQKLNERLRDLVMTRKTLLIDFTEAHPRIVEINDQIHGLIYGIQKALGSRLAGLRDRETELANQLGKLRAATHAYPEKAQKLNRLQREVALQESLYSQLKTKYQEIRIQAAGKVEEVVLVRPASVPVWPINIPSKVTVVATGVILGLFMGVLFAFVAEMLDTSIGTIEDVESLLSVPVLGIIPQIRGEERARAPSVDQRELVVHFDPNSIAAEAFRSIRTNLQFMGMRAGGKCYVITSSFLEEGKTFISVNLAVSLAQAGHRVLMMEADLRNPTAHRVFGLPQSPGLSDYVMGGQRPEEVIQTITDVMVGRLDIDDILSNPGLDNLHYLTCGSPAAGPSEILQSERFRDLLRFVCDRYDIVIIDAPPILPVADAVDMAPLADGVVLIYSAGRIARGVLKRAKSALDNVSANVLGVVLNNVKPETGPDYFRYQSRYYRREAQKPVARSWGVMEDSSPGRSGGKWRPWLLGILLLGVAAAGLYAYREPVLGLVMRLFAP